MVPEGTGKTIIFILVFLDLNVGYKTSFSKASSKVVSRGCRQNVLGDFGWGRCIDTAKTNPPTDMFGQAALPAHWISRFNQTVCQGLLWIKGIPCSPAAWYLVPGSSDFYIWDSR